MMLIVFGCLIERLFILWLSLFLWYNKIEDKDDEK